MVLPEPKITAVGSQLERTATQQRNYDLKGTSEYLDYEIRYLLQIQRHKSMNKLTINVTRNLTLWLCLCLMCKLKFSFCLFTDSNHVSGFNKSLNCLPLDSSIHQEVFHLKVPQSNEVPVVILIIHLGW